MKKLAALLLAAGLLSLAGCGTTHHTTKQWEYKVTSLPSAGGLGMLKPENRQQFLDELGKDGWILVAVDPPSGLYYLKRPKQ